MHIHRHTVPSRRLAMTAFLLAGLLYCSGCRRGPAGPAPAVSVPDTFPVAFYNVENLFDDEFDGNEYPEYRPNATNWNREMQERKFDNIASAVAATGAAVIAFCEVEDRDALGELQRRLKEKGVRYDYSAIVDTARESNTAPALLSRYPVLRHTAYAVPLPDGAITRGILEADIGIGTTPLKLFVNHWPSKKHPESYRVAAAKTLAAKISSLRPGTDYIILGDFNSDCDEFASFATSGHNDSRDSTGINHFLGTVTSAGATYRLRTEREVTAAPFPSHFDPWAELPAAQRMSYYYQGNLQTIDHILLPPSLFDSTGLSYLDNSFNAFTWDGRLLADGKPLRWKLDFRGKLKYHAGEGYSDHLPVIARFTRQPFRFAPSTADEPALSADTGGWFEYHNSGWLACVNGARFGRDTLGPAAGSYFLRVTATALRGNETVARTIVRPSERGKNGVIGFSLRGSGTICFRTKSAEGKWRYHHLDDGTASGRAKYAPVNFPAWRAITLQPSEPEGIPVELELRAGKGTILDIGIDR